MGFKEIIKRIALFILRGVPQVTVNVTTQRITADSLFSQKNILITGGGSGIGFAIAEKVIKCGANVIITGRNIDKLKEAASKLGENAKYICHDITKINSIEAMLNKAKEMTQSGDIDILVCNAGISLHEENIEHVTIENFEKQMSTNLEGAYFLAQKFISNRIIGNEYSVLFISSERGYQCDDVPYGLSKAAINSLVKGLSRRYYSKGIRVNGVAPGITLSDMTSSTVKEDNFYAERLVSKRYFRPEEVAEVAAFLMSNASKCISGEIIACDAGEYISAYF